MNKSVVQVKVRGHASSAAGCAIFLGNEEKTFVFYVDHYVGNVIGMFLNQVQNERPLTHDLIGLILSAFDARVDRIIINDLKGETYFCRLILSVENELKHRKIVELDARPSDCIAIALQQKAPIYVSTEVWEEVEDVTPILRQIHETESNELPPDKKEKDDSDPSA